MNVESFLKEANRVSPEHFRRSYVARSSNYKRTGYTVKKGILSIIILGYVVVLFVIKHLWCELPPCIVSIVKNLSLLLVCILAVILLPITVIATFFVLVKNVKFV